VAREEGRATPVARVVEHAEIPRNVDGEIL